jgi:acyl-CoA synthetase (AMP-forming)/AMP-acid ligase II
MYTSGTTGAPKGVLMSRRAIAAGLDGLGAAWAWGPHDTLVHGLPLFHVHGLVLGTLGALRLGSRLVHTGKPTPEAYAAAAVRGGSLYFGVPTVWGRVCQEPDAARMLTSARLLVSGSAPLPVPVFEQLAVLTGQPPVERYGMTETLITVSTRFDGERRPGWVGLPIGGVATRLVDDDGVQVPHDGSTIGELQVSGATLFDGYLGRPDATSAASDGAWFRTGDAAVIDNGGFHRIVGRQSMDIIKTGGFKVGAGEVETVLLGHPSGNASWRSWWGSPPTLRHSSSTSPRNCRCTSARERCVWWPSCRATRWVRCRSTSSRHPEGYPSRMELEDDIVADLLRRLARIEGQVRGVQAMLRDNRECRDIVTQISAAGKALDQVGFKLLAAGMATCLSDPAKAAKAGFDPEEVEKLFLKLA